MKLIDIRTGRSKREEVEAKRMSPQELRLHEFAQEVEIRMKRLEAAQKKQDAILSRLIRRIAKLMRLRT